MQYLWYEKIHGKNNLTYILSEKRDFLFLTFEEWKLDAW